MVLDGKKISESIRMKKKKMMSADPDLVDTDALVDINPNDHFFMEKHAQIEEALGSPDKINAMNTEMDQSPHDAGTMGETSDEEKRMARMKRMMDAMDL